MEVGTEISQKIRSAIKAKLLELGAYVDDELPDYIMVMVANKRSRSQMNSDLGLFLASNTVVFTEWLHSLLEKLQTVRADSERSASKQRKVEKSKSKRKDKSHHGDAAEKSNKDAGEEKTTGHGDDASSSHKKTESLEEAKSGSVSNEGHSEQKNGTEDNKSSDEGRDGHKIAEAVEDVRQLLVTEAHEVEFAEELETAEAEVQNSRTLKDVAAKPVLLTQKEISTATTSQSPSPKTPGVQTSTVSRKRKAPTSVVANVSRKEGDDEEYDPHIPAVGSVASVVKVTARKSSIPPAMQANRQVNNKVRESQAEYGEPPGKLIKLVETISLEDIKQAMEDVLKKTQVANDDVAQFSRMVESSLRTLRPQDLSLAKLRIQQVLFDIELSAVQEGKEDCKLQETAQPDVVSQDSNTFRSNSPTTVGTNSKLDVFMAHDSSECTSSSGVHCVSSHRVGLAASTVCSNVNSCNSEVSNLLEVNKHNVSLVASSVYKIGTDRNEDCSFLKTDCSSSENLTSSDFSESHLNQLDLSGPQLDRIVFNPKPKSEKIMKSSQIHDVVHDHMKCDNSAVKPRDKTPSVAPEKREQPLKSPASSSKVCESPNSVHSSSPVSTMGIDGRQSREFRKSTLSPTDQLSKPGASHINRSKSSSTSKSLPSILVDSIHNKKRSESAETASVLRQSCVRDRSPRGADLSEQDESRDSPRQLRPETLKVMAKNLKITVINEHAAKFNQGSSTDDSSSDDSDDDSSDDEEDDNGGGNKSRHERGKEKTAVNNKAKSNASLL